MSKDDKVCIICYEKVGLLKFNTICNCNFYYHIECYEGWLDINSICLICRKPIKKRQLYETINPLLYNRSIVRTNSYTNRVPSISSVNSTASNEDNETARKCIVIILSICLILGIAFIFAYVFYN